MDRWAFRFLVREAALNVFGRGARLFPALMLAGLLASLGVALLAIEQTELRQEVADLEAGGMGVVVYHEASAEHPTRITRSSCERLSESPGVEAAGLLIAGGRTDMAPVAYDVPAQRASVSLVPQLANVDLLVGRTIDDRKGTYNVEIAGEILTAKKAPVLREGLGVGFQLTFPLLPEDTNGTTCVVVLDSLVSAGDVMPQQIASLNVLGNGITAQEVLAPQSDPLDRYLTRVTQYVPFGLGLVGGIATLLISRSRASELAVYRMSGTSRTSLFLLMSLESLYLGGVAAACGSAAALLLMPVLFDPGVAVVGGIVTASTWVVVSTLGGLSLGLQVPSELAKDH